MTSLEFAPLAPPFKVKAKYGWSGQAKGDLGFLEGDVMEVTKITGDWYYGRLLRNRKCSGYFPNNFVKIVEERLNETSNTSTPTSSHPNKKKDSKVPKQQEASNKVVIPPIPSRSVDHSSTRSSRKPTSASTTNDHSLYTNGNNSIPNVTTNSVRPTGPKYKSSSAMKTVHNHYNYSNSNDLQNFSNNNVNSNRIHHYTDRRKMTRTPLNIKTNYSDDSLPPLPQIPNFSSRFDDNNNSNRHYPSHAPINPIPTKSYSMNDIRTSRYRDSDYYRDNQQFFDGYQPTNKSNESLESNSSTGIFSNSKYMENSLTSSENSFALMSDFSATSAGSLARHKYAQSFADSLERSQTSNNMLLDLSLNTTSTNIPSNSSSSKMGGLLSKFLPKSNNNNNASNNNNGDNSLPGTPVTPVGDYPRLPDLRNLNISQTHNEARDWLNVKSQVNRSRTLTKYEKHPRYMRVLEQNRDLVLHPQDAIYNDLNTNEVKGNDIIPGQLTLDLLEMNVDYVDKMTRKRCIKDGAMRIDNWSQTTFSARYPTVLEKLRGIYIFCTEMFELIDDNGVTNFTQEPPNLDQTLHKRYCTPYELTWLFKKLSNSLGITCEIVIGFLKTPTANNWEFKYNHCWLRVLVNKEWRFIDVILGNISNPIHEFVNNKKRIRADDSYFMVEPLDFIYTHIPPREFEQHIVPSVDPLSAIYLPLVFPTFFQNNIKLYKFSTALSFLEDSEVYECSLEIPSDIEVFSSVVVKTDNQEKEIECGKKELALTQIRRNKAESGRRIVVIKAILPPGITEGMLYIHSGLRGSQTTVANIHPLSMIIPLYHKGEDMNFEFVVRKPCESVRRIETYIVEPQNRYIYTNNDYNFEVIQHPYDGILYDESSINTNRKQSMIIKSPSGKTYEMLKNDPHFPFGTWKVNIKIKEAGIWTASVAADSGTGYCEFAEWLCV
ncbi:hypothetical protein TBLA_0B09620 [Henningerozyma blattae CBS 6284]|uniref:SH3 domain-containing protein n=1 Tax=Henningerozyma blattae (strain ATCC 34711 / CBS 6284 / DSM 70876 / NBRC 10599 / NRRL Y-10934 / UCD 77-7) TaxID=1071380 RepID=I2H077_HENB6|nr:hypothetical protein TBLA_0B09620 [Tetrapisispora blattae CBS 6284]CCH59779.1 hypothetical protein TBLA_0B09620 [Tetrapisispora blattae CBS 6284]